MSPSRVLSTIVVCVLSVWAAVAAAKSCTSISSLPVVITEPGSYCLASNLAIGAPEWRAIAIEADHVDIDFNGHTLDNPDRAVSWGILAIDRSNVSVRNGTIRGFVTAITFTSETPELPMGAANIISNMVFDQTVQYSLDMASRNILIEKNRFQDIGMDSPSGDVRPIYLYGSGAHIRKNSFINTVSRANLNSGETTIFLYAAPGCVIEENDILNTGNNPSSSIGVVVWNSSNCTIRKNDFENASASPLDIGIWVIASDRVEIKHNDFVNVTNEISYE